MSTRGRKWMKAGNGLVHRADCGCVSEGVGTVKRTMVPHRIIARCASHHWAFKQEHRRQLDFMTLRNTPDGVVREGQGAKLNDDEEW